jgi:hypothetical protein
LLNDWNMWARPEQLAPDGAWRAWIFMGGRGAGKTRAGAQWANVRALNRLRRSTRRGRVAHAAAFPALEDEMCAFGAGDFSGSPDRVDALLWALTDLMHGGARRASECSDRTSECWIGGDVSAPGAWSDNCWPGTPWGSPCGRHAIRPCSSAKAMRAMRSLIAACA